MYCVIAEAVTMFVDRSRAVRELVRVCRPGGRVLATEFLWRKPPTPEARQIFVDEVCPGMQFDTLDDWVQLYQAAGLSNVQVTSGPFEIWHGSHLGTHLVQWRPSVSDRGRGAVFGAIWDLDGTLVDTEMNHYAAWRDLLREHDRDLTHREFQPTFGLRNDDVLVHHFGFEGDASYITALSERKEDLFRASLQRDGVHTQPGALDMIAHLSGLGARQAIASSAPPVNIEVILRLLGLDRRFDAIVSGEEVAHGKPAPDIMLRAAERLDLPPARAVVLEDAPAGIAAGKSAGCRVVAIASTFARERLAEADLIVASFAEVLWPAAQWEEFLR